MWFAALGSYQRNPWLIHLMDKILEGCPQVLDLLDEPKLYSGVEQVMQIRADIWLYDFSRIDTEWARRIPDVSLLEKSSNKSMFRLLARWPERYWTRSSRRSYLPPIEKGNPAVSSFLSRHRFVKTCPNDVTRCSKFEGNLVSRCLCDLAVILRARSDEILLPIPLTVIFITLTVSRFAWKI
mmetsp:Transcript_22498/g.40602  ORF Transcript_22498/g.40602 Transcript_22498/m.40602 type:complete len:182 (+) Transcript_22498:1779-2324(+)